MTSTRLFTVLVFALLVGLLIGLWLGHRGFAGAMASRLKQAMGEQRFLQPPDAVGERHRRERLAFFRSSPAPADIVMLGDSHSENGPWSELLPGRSVLNRGIGWDSSTDVLQRLDEVIARKPGTVFLLIGIVDLRYGEPVDEVAARIETIASRLRQAGIRTVVQSVLPVAPQLREPTNEKVRALNERLRADPGYLDLHPVLVQGGALDPALTADGVHLTLPAYQRWAAVVEQALKPARDASRPG